jgi:hypothetical protein
MSFGLSPFWRALLEAAAAYLGIETVLAASAWALGLNPDTICKVLASSLLPALASFRPLYRVRYRVHQKAKNARLSKAIAERMASVPRSKVRFDSRYRGPRPPEA